MKEEFIKYIRDSLRQNAFVKLTLGKYRGNETGLENIYVEPVLIGDDVQLSFRMKYKTKDIFKNFDFDSAASAIGEYLGKDFLYSALYTVKNDIILEFNKKREGRIYKKGPTFSKVDVRSHNRIKSRFIDNKSRFLSALGITNKAGEVHSNSYGKFRQLDRFIEIVDSLYKESGLPGKEKLNITDYGSGKSYLTFALYQYFRNSLKREVNITGVEQRDDLVDLSNRTAVLCGFKNLNFEKSSVLHHENKSTDIVVALHACDTATDDAIAKAIGAGSEIIILAPCCQKYVRKQISIPQNLKSIFKHGIIEEHISSFVTDGLRGLMLEACGYKTKIFEFVSPEHTSKNIMITAVKSPAADGLNVEKFKEMESIKSQFGLKDFYLDTIIGTSNVKRQT